MQEKHSCGGSGVNPKPAKFDVDDKYGGLRRKAKREEWEKKGLI